MIQWKKLIFCIALPLAVGGLSAFLTQDSRSVFETLNRPFLSPPAWVFPVVWTLLYILMGTASYLVLVSGDPEGQIREALSVYGVQLAVNFFWSIIFFQQTMYLTAFFWLLLLLFLVVLTAVLFYGISKAAAYLLLPYTVWVAFAGYLNLSIWILNR